MADTTYSSPGTTRPPRKRQFPFGLVMLAFGLGLGFYGGVAATKRAMTAPNWVQHMFGLPPMPSAVTTTVAATPSPTATTPPPVQPAVTSPAPSADTSAGSPVNPEKPAKSSVSNNEKPDSSDLTGRWEVTDSLPSQSGPASSVTSAYVFNADNTGEFDSNNKKMYDFEWKPAGEDISITYNGDGPDSGQEWTVKMKWSLNSDHTVLTLIPENGKDARSYLYALGPGVYHKK